MFHSSAINLQFVWCAYECRANNHFPLIKVTLTIRV